MNFYEKLNEKEWIYKEKTFDDYYENFDEKYKIKIEKFISSLDERMKKYIFFNNIFKMFYFQVIFHTISNFLIMILLF